VTARRAVILLAASVDDAALTRERICELAGQPAHSTIAWRLRLDTDTVRSGTLFDGALSVAEGLIIDCVPTGMA
jgi:hypothetical protein